MDHESFSVVGYEFMDDPATDQQKDLIAELAERDGRPIDRQGVWPVPFSKWDAAIMIEAIEQSLRKKILTKIGAPSHGG